MHFCLLYHAFCMNRQTVVTWLVISLTCIGLSGCQSQPQDVVLVGRPTGSYRLELTLTPPLLRAQQETMLTYRILDTLPNNLSMICKFFTSACYTPS
jgi:hypothetical protein